VNRSFEDLEFVPVDQFANGTAKFDLTFTVNEDPGQIKFTVEYYSRIYEEATIRKMTERYVDIIRQVDRDPDIRGHPVRIQRYEDLYAGLSIPFLKK
jgi:non-ribosomal peptide synthetase component F